MLLNAKGYSKLAIGDCSLLIRRTWAKLQILPNFSQLLWPRILKIPGKRAVIGCQLRAIALALRRLSAARYRACASPTAPTTYFPAQALISFIIGLRLSAKLPAKPESDRMKVLDTSNGSVETLRQKAIHLPPGSRYSSTFDR